MRGADIYYHLSGLSPLGEEMVAPFVRGADIYYHLLVLTNSCRNSCPSVATLALVASLHPSIVAHIMAQFRPEKDLKKGESVFIAVESKREYNEVAWVVVFVVPYPWIYP